METKSTLHNFYNLFYYSRSKLLVPGSTEFFDVVLNKNIGNYVRKDEFNSVVITFKLKDNEYNAEYVAVLDLYLGPHIIQKVELKVQCGL